MNLQDKRSFFIKKDGKYFFHGLIAGILFSSFWCLYLDKSEFFENYVYNEKLLTFKNQAREKLLDYIDGKWASSIGDVNVVINIDRTRDVVLVEYLNNKREEKQYKIEKIDYISGLMGIITLHVCEINKDCSNDAEEIPIQINKLFGVEGTIVLTYDSNLTYCIDSTNSCSRAFKRM